MKVSKTFIVKWANLVLKENSWNMDYIDDIGIYYHLAPYMYLILTIKHKKFVFLGDYDTSLVQICSHESPEHAEECGPCRLHFGNSNVRNISLLD